MTEQPPQLTDRQKIKTLKQAVREERAEKATIIEELKIVKEQNKQLSQEYETQSNRYLALYGENEKLQELVNTLKKGQKSNGEITNPYVVQHVPPPPRPEIKVVNQINLEKLERELGIKSEEARSYREIASQAAEKSERQDR